MLEPVLPIVRQVLIMSVNPGFGGQTFIPASLGRIRRVRELLDAVNPTCRLEVDGGIKIGNAGKVVAAGADTLVAGSAIYAPEIDIASAMRALRSEVDIARLVKTNLRNRMSDDERGHDARRESAMEWSPIRMTYHVRTYRFGERLIPEILGKQGVPDGVVAETWEISDQKDTRATITSEPFAGRLLHDVVAEHPDEVVGPVGADRTFPSSPSSSMPRICCRSTSTPTTRRPAASTVSRTGRPKPGTSSTPRRMPRSWPASDPVSRKTSCVRHFSPRITTGSCSATRSLPATPSTCPAASCTPSDRTR